MISSHSEAGTRGDTRRGAAAVELAVFSDPNDYLAKMQFFSRPDPC